MNMEPTYISGDEVAAVLKALYASPRVVVERAKKIINPEGAN